MPNNQNAFIRPELEVYVQREAWQSVAEILGGEDQLAMALGEKVSSFKDIASAQGKTQEALSTALHTQLYQKMTDVDNVGLPGGAPSREAAIRVMSGSEDRCRIS